MALSLQPVELGCGSVSISTKCKAKFFFTPESSVYCTVQNIENYDTCDAEEMLKKTLIFQNFG
jgi:hypothetical protein